MSRPLKRPRVQRERRSLRKGAPRPAQETYLLRLYVAGSSQRSRRAILRARELCAGDLHGCCTLEVIDIFQEPIRARNGQIVATPTLVREVPRPVRRLIGTLARADRLIVGLGLDNQKTGA